MRQFSLLFFLLIVGVVCSQNSTSSKAIPFTIGETVSVQSEILQENRTLNIYLPRGYDESKKKYPIIYLLDGSADEDFIHIAGLVQFGSFSWINMLPESIVVGISNIDRKRDFTFPSTVKLDQEEFPTSGGSEKFIQFLERELQPFIASRYKVSEEKTIIGQSLGGLLAAEILLKKPSLFNNYIIVSPSTWWDNESILKQEATKTWAPKQVYIAGGTEGPTMQTGAINLYYKLLAASKDTKNKVFYHFLEAQDHGDALHLAVYNAFEKLFENETKK
ncbi:alpha/beta hydrolase [Rasiella rasia]|uniref:Alpha/beta hydrolase n=1 Tax=Rasiella rasia TaxID=2744027 RepID=A0A6G6GPW7_9FLAO|nr:alpha/beta hydrolase-fold protein [Rasiella rasia]QIE60473.1 alpha/beta hydrolase [Rasiella rasia]